MHVEDIKRWLREMKLEEDPKTAAATRILGIADGFFLSSSRQYGITKISPQLLWMIIILIP